MSNLAFKRIPWIFFDLDDTIWNFKENSAQALHQLYIISPILRKLFKDQQEFIDIYHSHNAILWLLYGRGEISTKELKVERWRRTLATRQFEVLTAICEELERTYLDILASCTNEINGVNECLGNLAKEALIGVISNGFSDTQYKKIKNSGLDKFVARMVISDEIGINKPDSRIFDYAISETGCSAPFLMIGDNVETDIYGALKAGWEAIWINPGNSKFPYSNQPLQESGIIPEKFLGSFPSVKEAYPTIKEFIIRFQSRH